MTDKTFTQEEVNEMLEKQKDDLRKETVSFIAEKAEELAGKKANALAIQIAEEYKELTIEEKLFEQDRKQLEFYIEQGALPSDMTLGKMMMNRQLGRELGLSLIQTINGVAFVNGKPTIYGETYLSLITKRGYKINVIKENDTEVEIELDGPNGKQIGRFTKADAEKAGIRKNVYLKYPTRMLRYKAIRNAQNILCPEIMCGAYLYEEANEIPQQQTTPVTDDLLREKLSGFSAEEGENKSIS